MLCKASWQQRCTPSLGSLVARVYPLPWSWPCDHVGHRSSRAPSILAQSFKLLIKIVTSACKRVPGGGTG